jgi:hypothetical protein
MSILPQSSFFDLFEINITNQLNYLGVLLVNKSILSDMEKDNTNKNNPQTCEYLKQSII